MDQFSLPSITPYSFYIDRTRNSLNARLNHAPAGNILIDYFERGKMLRAFLVFAASASVGGHPEEVLMAAEAIELLHAASLFHDDIIDQASERRGITSLHERLGIGPALVLGDDLLIRAFGVLAEARGYHPAERVLQAMETFNQLAKECCRGQFDELSAERFVSEKEYFAIISGKTAAPFIAAGVLGTVLGGGTKAQIAQISIYAQKMGVAYQIGDDLLDLISKPEILGKPVGNSVACGRPMLPLIYLLRNSSKSVREEVCRLDERGWPRIELAELLEKHRIFDRVRKVQERYISAAIRALKGFQDATGVVALRALATHVCLPLKNLKKRDVLGSALSGNFDSVFKLSLPR